MAIELYVCLDLGNDTLKISFAYEFAGMETYGKLMLPDLINQVALPASAVYDEDEKAWKYAEELEAADNRNFSTVVKIKSLLSLVVSQEDKVVEEQNRFYYREGHYFPKFSFPVRHRMQSDFQYMIDQKLVFEAPDYTPRSMCQAFFDHVRKTVERCIDSLSADTGLTFAPLTRLSIVHPPKQGVDYVEELKQLVTDAFGVVPTKILTSTQALGLLAFHKGLLNDGERVLLFDMGDETVSVTKAWLNEVGYPTDSTEEPRIGILIDSPEGHSHPLELGGSNIDEAIAAYLEKGIHNRETVGSPSVNREGHIYENGLCSQQYLLMKDIKKAKMLMPMTGRGIFSEGVPISVHREILVQRMLSAEEFRRCAGIGSVYGVANRVTQYILQELELPVNRDVTKILLAGGMIETHGLLESIQQTLAAEYPHLRLLTFENYVNDHNQYEIQFYETSTYAASVGGAIVAMKDYSVDAVLSYSYGTWLYHDNYKKHLKLFANRGALLTEEQNRFAMEATLDLGYSEQDCLEGDEMFSTIINMEEIRQRKYADRVTYDGEWLIVGNEGDYDRMRAREAIDLRVVAGGRGTEVHFFYNGDRVSLYSSNMAVIYFEEGFVVDRNGVATPFFSNLRSKNRVNIFARNLVTNRTMEVSASDIEFRLSMSAITVTTNT